MKRKGTLIIAILFFMIYALPVQAASPRLNYTKLTLYTGQTKTLKILNTKNKITWKSSNPNIVNVGKSTGKIKAKNAGVCYITARVGRKNLRCQMIIKKTIKLEKYLNKKPSVLARATSLRGGWVPNLGNAFDNDNYIQNKSRLLCRDNGINTNYIYFLRNYSDKNVTIFGVRIGDSVSSAIKNLKKNGFSLQSINKSNDSNYKNYYNFTKMNYKMYINTNHSNKVSYYSWTRN